MVLLELGNKIKSIFNKIEHLNQFDEGQFIKIMNEITIALIQADVNIQIIKKMKDQIQVEFKML